MAAMVTKEYLEKLICDITTEAFTKNKDSIVENIQKHITEDDNCTTISTAVMAVFVYEIIKQFNWILNKTLCSSFYDDNGEKLYDFCGDEGETKNEGAVALNWCVASFLCRKFEPDFAKSGS